MRILVTGSSGHLGEALIRVLEPAGHDLIGLDVAPGRYTRTIGSLADRSTVEACMKGVEAIFHTANLHKPHIVLHSRQDFVHSNVVGTLNLLEAAVTAGVERFVFTSTTSTFGRALDPPADAPAAWITEEVNPLPRNVYGVTKTAAEDLCELVHRDHGLPCLILRASRFFPRRDNRGQVNARWDNANVTLNELLYRRIDLEDLVTAHRLALERAPAIGFGRYIVSANTPFTQQDVSALRSDAPGVVRRLFPDYEAVYARHGWAMLPSIDRVYVNDRARAELGWSPNYDFRRSLKLLQAGEDLRSPLAIAVGAKGYRAVPLEPTMIAR